MTDLVIYGASDDLIEIEGIVSEEFPAYTATQVIVSDGDTVRASIRVEFDPDGTGEWRIQPTVSDISFKITVARGEDAGNDERGCPGYSDKITLDVSSLTNVSVTTEAARP